MNSHVLGLKWNHGSDSLVVDRGVNCEFQTFVTQRAVHSFVSSVFDIFGSLAPYTVRVCLLLKDIWSVTGQQWDNLEALRKQFIEWHSILLVLGEIVIPRCYFSNPFERCELLFQLNWAARVGPNSTELEALKPYHFLVGEHSVIFLSLTLDEIFDHRKRDVRAQAHANAM